MLEPIPIEERSKYRCRECGETRSVKYFIETIDPCESDKPFKAPYCNMCALKVSAKHTIDHVDHK